MAGDSMMTCSTYKLAKWLSSTAAAGSRCAPHCCHDARHAAETRAPRAVPAPHARDTPTPWQVIPVYVQRDAHMPPRPGDGLPRNCRPHGRGTQPLTGARIAALHM
eukprot:1905936-Prymnesium_polylepis.1